MKAPKDLTVVIDRMRFSTATATVLAGDDFWDGHNFERNGRNTFLYRTPKHNYFTVTVSQWQGESEDLTPLNQDEAEEIFQNLPEKRMTFEEAFPSADVQDA